LRKFGEADDNLNNSIDADSATQQYGEQLSLASKNMESLNALYAVQLESSANHMETQNRLMENLTASINDSEKLATEVSSLAQNMNQLNNVYGGMLSAMNVNKN